MSGRTVGFTLTEPQRDFVMSAARHPGLAAGYGSGKSQAGVVRIVTLALQYPGMNFAFVEPTFDLVRLIAWPRFEEVLTAAGIGYKLNKSESIMYLANGSKIIFRSADNPERLVGFEVSDALIDEADVISEVKAQEVWVKMLGRARQRKPDGKANTVACVSTPEGFRWLYRTYVTNPKPGYELIRAATYSNPYLPDSYIESLRETYPPKLIEAYLEGHFVNLTSGSVYPEFDRKLNHCDDSIRTGEPLHIGLDFNVLNMTAIIGTVRDGRPRALAELTGVRDTPTMARMLRERYGQRGHSITLYPDASGQNTSSKSASESDFTILRQQLPEAVIDAPPANGAVRDRINAVNAMIHNDKGERRLLVNTHACPKLTAALEQQPYDSNGEPDKKGGLDHPPDALGYWIVRKWPIARPMRAGSIGVARIG